MALNEALMLTARLLPYEVDEDQAINVLESYCDELPDKSFSRRLSCDRPEVSRFIRWVVKDRLRRKRRAGRPRPVFRETRGCLRQFSPAGVLVSDKSTWHRTGIGKMTFEWSEEEKEIVRVKLVPILKCDQATACEAVKRLVTLREAALRERDRHEGHSHDPRRPRHPLVSGQEGPQQEADRLRPEAPGPQLALHRRLALVPQRRHEGALHGGTASATAWPTSSATAVETALVQLTTTSVPAPSLPWGASILFSG